MNIYTILPAKNAFKVKNFSFDKAKVISSDKSELAQVSSMAIGCFDGAHRAHRMIFENLDENGAILCINKHHKQALLPIEYMHNYTQRPIFMLNLSEIKHLSADVFAANLHEIFPNLDYFVQGYDFRFGAGASGASCCLGARVIEVPELKHKGVSVHSKTIRQLLASAEIEQANELLGRAFSVFGQAISGQGLGAKKLVPTINIATSGWVLPADGVYLGEIYTDAAYKAAIFVGTRSSDGARTLEAHILEPYNAKDHSEGAIWCEFLRFLRPSMRFDSLDELRQQILKDLEQLRKMHER